MTDRMEPWPGCPLDPPVKPGIMRFGALDSALSIDVMRLIIIIIIIITTTIFVVLSS